jgi:hypothetical protein
MHFPSQKKERIYLKLDWKEIEKRKEKKRAYSLVT